MNQLLKTGQVVETQSIGKCTVKEFIGGGGQGEVYKATLEGKDMALKWYFPWAATPHQRKILEKIIDMGRPNSRFLWPLALVSNPQVSGFGYVMHLRTSRFKNIPDLLRRKINTTFKALAIAGSQLAESFYHLHCKGLCYRDIAWGNVFFDPKNGDILICDNDNVTVNNDKFAQVGGTLLFMAPELIREDKNARPCIQTDLHSLAVLLFYMLMFHNPLDGKKETAIHSYDLPAIKKLYGYEPVFIFDPDDDSNRPVKGYHDNAIIFWQIYPNFIKDLFTKAFTHGIHDPENGRVRESEWRNGMIALQDSLFYCPYCGKENFYDTQHLSNHGLSYNCWSCSKPLQLPPRIKIEEKVIMLNYDTILYSYHVDKHKTFDTEEVAKIVQHPQNVDIWGLKNQSDIIWNVTKPDGSMLDVPPGKSISIIEGIRINFGNTVGEIRV